MLVINLNNSCFSFFLLFFFKIYFCRYTVDNLSVSGAQRNDLVRVYCQYVGFRRAEAVSIFQRPCLLPR